MTTEENINRFFHGGKKSLSVLSTHIQISIGTDNVPSLSSVRRTVFQQLTS
jgi:hypothetical protein